MDKEENSMVINNDKQGEEDISGCDKKKKAGKVSPSSSSSSTASTTAHGHDHVVPLRRLHLISLPDIAHDAIASYLTMKDMHYMMESSQGLMEVYGGKIKELVLAQEEGEEEEGEYPSPPPINLVSMMRRRPGVTHITMGVDVMAGVAMAMREGCLHKVGFLSIQTKKFPWKAIKPVSDALADGFWPKLKNIVLYSEKFDLVRFVGPAFRSRMEKKDKGCDGLQPFIVSAGGSVSTLSPLLSSGACEMLEEIKLEGCSVEDEAKEDLSKWLSRTKAPHLQTLSLAPSPSVVAALCSPGVAPRLKTLRLTIDEAHSVTLLSESIRARSWPQLNHVVFDELDWIDKEPPALSHLVAAIGMGAPEVTILELTSAGIGPEGGRAVARMLKDGGCPRSEELDLSLSKIGDAVAELMRALEAGAPCNRTIRWLVLGECGMTSVGARELAQAMERGALPCLEYLDLSDNDIGDGGVVALAEAMSTRRAFRSLQELHLEVVGMGPGGARALFQALRDHKACPHLKELSVGGNPKMVDDGVVELAGAIQAGALQQLQELQIDDVRMRANGFKSLVKAIVAQGQPNSGCPRLTVLDINRNLHVNDECAMYLAEMMKVKGAMQQLREIGLRDVSIGGKGIKALVEALGGSNQVCPKLRAMHLPRLRPEEAGATSIDELVEQVNARRGRRCCKVRMLYEK